MVRITIEDTRAADVVQVVARLHGGCAGAEAMQACPGPQFGGPCGDYYVAWEQAYEELLERTRAVEPHPCELLLDDTGCRAHATASSSPFTELINLRGVPRVRAVSCLGEATTLGRALWAAGLPGAVEPLGPVQTS